MDLFTVTNESSILSIFNHFKKQNRKFAIVTDESNSVGLISMQDIMEAIFGDIPELEDYSAYFYPVSYL
ncbi:CBS domain-containing protein [Pedobacter jamesrossensis]|uniref:CBS domain-containing protein n=1 Tax=Pedobacter jamesrossensis TaxID=1908238 RepID=A0ABV8NIZ1_9SPHI